MRPVPALTFALTLLSAIPAHSAQPSSSPLRVSDFDRARRIDVNRVNMWVTNFGSFANDLSTGNSGLVFPRGSGKTAVYESGLWLGCIRGGGVRVALSEYDSEYGPGVALAGIPDDASRPEYQVYKVLRFSGDPSDSAHVDRTAAELAADPSLDPLAHHSWREYLTGAAPFGAPIRLYRLPVTATPDSGDSIDVPGPDVSGDQMLWCVYNDADPSGHINRSGRTAPIGVEVQQSTFAFNAPGPLENTVFIRFRIINRGIDRLQDMFVSLWSDPDVGGFTDDLAGSDPARGLGYAYNGTTNDAIYGTEPPAVGYDLLSGPFDSASGSRLGFTAFSKYTSGTDPAAPQQVFNYMHGLQQDGSPVIDPTTGLATRYFHPGDPLTGSGWIDSNPADRRFLVSSGPFSTAPGDSQEVLVAIVLGQCSGNIASIDAMRESDDYVQSAFDHGLAPPFPPGSTACNQISNCPRPPAFWGEQCGGGHMSASDLTRIADCVNGQSSLFDWPVGSPLAPFCAIIAPSDTPDARAAAKREFAALLANLCADRLDLTSPDGDPIVLAPLTPVSCPGLTARTIGELVATADLRRQFAGADYLNDNPNHRTALEGVNFFLGGFGGGAGPAFNLLGSSLDPVSAPDSFVTVELRFSGVTTQRAYRYLRRERASDGLSPPQGPGYLYAGYFDVRFTAWDTDHGEQLDVAFVERTLTADDGTILPDGQQPATHDSTWGPDSSPFGGREYLMVIKRPYSPTPKPEFAHDGAPVDGASPMMWALGARKRDASDVIDDGDRFRWTWGIPPSPGADLALFMLEGQPLSDPAVLAAYQDIESCLGAINRGEGIGGVCDIPTPVMVSLMSVLAEPERVRLTWLAGGEEGIIATVYRRTARDGWSARGRIAADRGELVYEDTQVVAGTRYGYRIGVEESGTETFLGETWVDVPRTADFALVGLRPNPSSEGLAAAFSLPDASPAQLELLDLAGRRLIARQVGALGAGSHVVSLTRGRALAPGIYLVRLSRGGRSLTARAVIIR